MGKYDESLEYYNKALEIKLKKLGNDHPGVATTYNNMAGVYDSQGKYDEALKYHNKSLVINLKKLGNDHPHVAETYNNMANVYYSQGKYDESLEYYNKALEIKLKKLGNDHPDMAEIYNNMALLYKNKLNNKAKAKTLFEDCVRIYTIIYGENHSETTDARIYVENCN